LQEDTERPAPDGTATLKGCTDLASAAAVGLFLGIAETHVTRGKRNG